MNWVEKVKSYSQDKIDDYNEGVRFPATKDQIVSHARENNLPREVIDRLEKLPDKQYNNIGEIVSATAKSGD